MEARSIKTFGFMPQDDGMIRFIAHTDRVKIEGLLTPREVAIMGRYAHQVLQQQFDNLKTSIVYDRNEQLYCVVWQKGGESGHFVSKRQRDGLLAEKLVVQGSSVPTGKEQRTTYYTVADGFTWVDVNRWLEANDN